MYRLGIALGCVLAIFGFALTYYWNNQHPEIFFHGGLKLYELWGAWAIFGGLGFGVFIRVI